MFSRITKQSGFTIVELLIVIVVIGILAALVLNTFNGIQDRARDNEVRTDINAVHAQLEAFYADEGVYPNPRTDTEANFQADLNGYTADGANSTTINLDDQALVHPVSGQSYSYNGTGCVGTAGADGAGGTNHCTGYNLQGTISDTANSPYEKASLN